MVENNGHRLQLPSTVTRTKMLATDSLIKKSNLQYLKEKNILIWHLLTYLKYDAKQQKTGVQKNSHKSSDNSFILTVTAQTA